jgi:c-di-GMP-binding flagellar brake protein YcgR
MKHVQVKKEVEKRNYFRIDDIAILHYRVVSKDSHDEDKNHDDQLLIDKLTLKARFDCITREMQPLFRVVEAGSPEIAQYLSALDKKLNLLSEYYVEIAMSEMDMTPQKVNLGAGGLSFISASPIMSGSTLELRLVLLPEHTGIFSYARVVACTRNTNDMAEPGHYRISVEFERMSADVQDIISRHVLAREQESIRKAGAR